MAGLESLPKLDWTDYLIIALYFVVVLIVGLWATFRPNRETGTSEGYFLARKNMSWFPIGASLFATNYGAHMFVGLAGSAAALGLGVAIFELHAVYLLIFLGWVCNPVYAACGAFTVPQYVRRRFRSRRLQVTLAIVFIGMYISNVIAIYAGTLFLRYVLGWNTYLSVFALLVVTTVYTIVGGLAAVVYTDTLQMIVFVMGAFVILIQSLNAIGGWENLVRKYAQAASNITLNNLEKYACGMPPVDAFHIFRSVSDENIPWTGAISGLTLMGMRYWCFDQVEVQRGLAAKNVTHAKAGALLCGLLKILATFLFIIPGMISRALYPEQVACADPKSCTEICGNPAGCWNVAYPLLMINLLPSGLQGLMMAAILAALMSTLTSVFNSASALFTIDIWSNIRPRAQEKEVIMVSRMSVLVLMALSILWLPVLELSPGGQLWDKIQRVAANCGTPCAVILLFAMFWKRATESGAFWGLLTGLSIGMSRFTLDWIYPAPICGSGQVDSRPVVLSSVNYLHFSAILGIATALVVIVVSLVTTPVADNELSRVTWWTRDSKDDPIFHDTEDSMNEAKSKSTTAYDTGRKTIIDKLNEIAFVWICGLSDTPKQQLTKEQRMIILREQTSIKEVKLWMAVVNILAVILLVVTTGLCGFFG